MKFHYTHGGGVPSCRNVVSPRGRKPQTTRELHAVTCEKCRALIKRAGVPTSVEGR